MQRVGPLPGGNRLIRHVVLKEGFLICCQKHGPMDILGGVGPMWPLAASEPTHVFIVCMQVTAVCSVHHRVWHFGIMQCWKGWWFMSMNLIKSCKPLNRSRSSVFCSTQLAAEAESDYWWLTTWPLNNLSQLIEEYCWERLVAQVIDAVHCMYVQLYTTLMQDVNVCTWWSLSVNCHRGIITMSFTIIINVMSIIIWLCLPVIVAWSPGDISVTSTVYKRHAVCGTTSRRKQAYTACWKKASSSAVRSMDLWTC